MSTLLLAACGDKEDKETNNSTTTSSSVEKMAGGDLQDGTYTLEEQNENKGYRDVFTSVVKDGKIAEAKYDNVNADGKSKTEDADYNKMMKEKSRTNLEASIPALNETLLASQSTEGVDVVTGATQSTHAFQTYA